MVFKKINPFLNSVLLNPSMKTFFISPLTYTITENLFTGIAIITMEEKFDSTFKTLIFFHVKQKGPVPDRLFKLIRNTC